MLGAAKESCDFISFHFIRFDFMPMLRATWPVEVTGCDSPSGPNRYYYLEERMIACMHACMHPQPNLGSCVTLPLLSTKTRTLSRR
mmetsp:Transcript_19747/g.55805  ORF Transcript_19747/g.55805 Transcript_19747/m.55805 type:complete len:86 (-) Transcript_19747:387-644(-)